MQVMATITRKSLMSLEEYAVKRKDFRTRVMAHKHNRKVHLGEHITLLFEDELTIRYQIQEMLRAERIFEEEGIVDELDAYNPLIPDGSNWKATMLIEYPDESERKQALARLINVEDKVWIQVDGQPKVFAIADEDLERETEEKTSSVHFLRFELTASMKEALKRGQALAMGIDHPNCAVSVDKVAEAVRQSLMNDLVL
jgi:hypothetical protein